MGRKSDHFKQLITLILTVIVIVITTKFDCLSKTDRLLTFIQVPAFSCSDVGGFLTLWVKVEGGHPTKSAEERVKHGSGPNLLLWSILPTIYEQLFCTKVFWAAFLYLHCRFKLFRRKEIGAKAARKMLVKLTPCGKSSTWCSRQCKWPEAKY